MTTASEIEARMVEGQRQIEALAERYRCHALDPLIDEVFGRLCGAPRRRRWDQFGAYHRRQMKKWSKRMSADCEVIS